MGWLWLFGMNYLTAMIRIPTWIAFGLRRNKLHPRRNFDAQQIQHLGEHL
jgi:hypothetical protein